MVTDLLVLRNQDVTVSVDPAQGGAVREFRKQELHLFRPTPPEARADPFLFSCFPMVPYANRIAHGRFHVGDQEIRIPRNWHGDPHPLHGQGWRCAWSVEARSAASAILSFHGGGDSWPWAYRCKQWFEVRHDGLSVKLSLENLTDTPMPAVIGLHPYFPDAQEARLTTLVPSVWRTEENLAVENVATPAEWQFAASQRVSDVSLDHSFSDWPGAAAITWPNRRLRIQATNCNHLHVYTPSGRDFFCIEPQTAPAGALNRGKDIDIVAPHAELSMQVDFIIGEA